MIADASPDGAGAKADVRAGNAAVAVRAGRLIERAHHRLFRSLHPVRQLTAARRALPDVVIAGAQKAGTTYLWSLLARQPGWWGPPIKEIHYFDLNHRRGEAWYRAHFRPKAPGRLQVEASPFYMFHPSAPARLAAALPEARVIVLLRDPAERAYSHFKHNQRAGREPLSFADACAAEEARIAPDLAALAADADAACPNLRHYSYIARGDYAAQVERLQAVLAAERLHFVDAAPLFAGAGDEIARLEGFLGQRLDLDAAHGARRNAGGHGSRRPAEIAGIAQHFAASDARLRALTGRDWSWLP